MTQLRALFQEGYFTELNLWFALFIANFCPQQDKDVALAAALVSRSADNGDICLDLNLTAGRELSENNITLKCPALSFWRERLLRCKAVGTPGDYNPLILDDQNRLYLYRYWEYENNLLELIQEKISIIKPKPQADLVLKSLNRFFPQEDEKGTTNWQKEAAIIALKKYFCVISGGPGTGKTTTITRILAFLLELSSDQKLRIQLAAPTGKAAARLAETIRSIKDKLDCSEKIKQSIPVQTSTIHRLLKPVKGTPYFYFNALNPLPVDLLVVDEASMVDLALMTKLFQALPKKGSLVLLGDKDQLASVEAGAVFGDICENRPNKIISDIEPAKEQEFNGHEADQKKIQRLKEHIIILQKSYRFKTNSGIALLSQAVRQGDFCTSLALLKNQEYDDIRLSRLPSPAFQLPELGEIIIEKYKPFLTAAKPQKALDNFNNFRILGAVKSGPFGVNALNLLVENILSGQGMIAHSQKDISPWYRGRPILITENDYNLGLFNGDIGITFPDETGSEQSFVVYFNTDSNQPRKISTHRLPAHQTVYAMTVHKSQGSEFDNLLLVLPEKDYSVLTRELIYTGITRAKKRVIIWSDEKILTRAISRKIIRNSGVGDGLWGQIQKSVS